MSRFKYAASFRRLLQAIEPKPKEVLSARRHLKNIKARLNKSFDIARVAIIGSHAKKTAVRNYSDVDILVVLRKKEVLWGGSIISSSTLLKHIRDDLFDRYPMTEVRRDTQAVAVRFASGGLGVDVVPAFFDAPLYGKHPIYYIPNGTGGWINTSPDAQLKYLNDTDDKYKGKLKNIIKLIKWWKYARTATISINSFYLETVLSNSCVRPGGTYSSILGDSFITLNGIGAMEIPDPLGISGLLDLANTSTKTIDALASINYSTEHSIRAKNAAMERDYDEAIRQWDIVFNGNFRV